MLVDRICVVPKANGRPAAVLEALQRDRIRNGRRRLAAPEPDADTRLHVNKDFASCRHHRQRVSESPAVYLAERTRGQNRDANRCPRRQASATFRWGGKDSNLRPTDYESRRKLSIEPNLA